MIRLPLCVPLFPVFHIPQSLLIIIGYFFFFINRKYYDDYDGVWKLWIKERLRNPPKVIHSYCRFIPILIHKAGVAERRYCSGISGQAGLFINMVLKTYRHQEGGM